VNNTQTKNRQNGQIMIEVMVALSIATLSMLGALSLLSSSIATDRFISDKYIASYLAAGGDEIVKNIISLNGPEFSTGLIGCDSGCAFQYDSTENITNHPPYINPSTTRLMLDKSTGIYSYDASGVATPFYRIVKITIPNPDKIDVVSTVKWISRGNIENSITVYDEFYDWYNWAL